MAALPTAPSGETSLYCLLLIQGMASETGVYCLCEKPHPLKDCPPLCCSFSAHIRSEKYEMVWTVCREGTTLHSAQTSHSASHSTPLHTLPNPSLFMTITTGLLLSNTCVCMQSLDFGAQHTQVVWTCSSKQSQWEGPYCSWGVSMNEVCGV